MAARVDADALIALAAWVAWSAMADRTVRLGRSGHAAMLIRIAALDSVTQLTIIAIRVRAAAQSAIGFAAIAGELIAVIAFFAIFGDAVAADRPRVLNPAAHVASIARHSIAIVAFLIRIETSVSADGRDPLAPASGYAEHHIKKRQAKHHGATTRMKSTA